MLLKREQKVKKHPAECFEKPHFFNSPKQTMSDTGDCTDF